MDYGFYTTTSGPFDAALQRVTDELKKEGFGVLSDIDIRKAMKEKLGKDLPAYRILGACNPPLAFQALSAEVNVGLLLPCNVIVREGDDGRIVVGFLNPDMMVGLTANDAMQSVAQDATARLRRVCAAVGAG